MRELAAKLASQNVVLEPELDLALDQALLAALLTHIPLLIAVQDRAGYYRQANQPTLFGDTLLGRRNSDLFPDIAAARLDALQACARKHHAVVGPDDIELPTAASGRRWFSVTCVTVKNTAGGLQILTLAQDITERKRTEQRLREQAAHYRSVYQSIPAMLHSVDAKGRIAAVSDRWLAATGYQREDVIGRLCSEFLSTKEVSDEPSTSADIWRNQRWNNKPYELIKKDGTSMDVELSAIAMDDGFDDIQSGLAIVRDVTDRNRAERELRQRNHELARSNEALEQFAGAASHDLQTPLRHIAQYANFLQEDHGDRLDGEAQRYLEQMTQSVGRMQKMIVSLLNFSSITADQKQFEPIPMTQAAAIAQENLQLLIDESHADISSDELPAVCGDKPLLIQLLQNLLHNAIKYRGDQPPRIHIGVLRGDTEWLFSITDNGIGILPKHADRIFQIFKRLHRYEIISGVGIGLALCRRIFDLHGGRIWLNPDYQAGSQFCFTLPIDKSLDSTSG